MNSDIAKGSYGPRHKRLLKAIKRNDNPVKTSAWDKARVSKFIFKKVGGGGGSSDRNNAAADNYDPPVDYCKCSGAGSVGEFQDTLIKDYDYPIGMTDTSDPSAEPWKTNRHLPKRMDYTKTWNLVGPYKNPFGNEKDEDINVYKGLKALNDIAKYKVTWFYKKGIHFYEIGTHDMMNIRPSFDTTDLSLIHI